MSNTATFHLRSDSVRIDYHTEWILAHNRDDTRRTYFARQIDDLHNDAMVKATFTMLRVCRFGTTGTMELPFV